MTMRLVTLPQMVDFALCAKEHRIVHFGILHTFLHALLRQLKLENVKIEFEHPGGDGISENSLNINVAEETSENGSNLNIDDTQDDDYQGGNLDDTEDDNQNGSNGVSQGGSHISSQKGSQEASQIRSHGGSQDGSRRGSQDGTRRGSQDDSRRGSQDGTRRGSLDDSRKGSQAGSGNGSQIISEGDSQRESERVSENHSQSSSNDSIEEANSVSNSTLHADQFITADVPNCVTNQMLEQTLLDYMNQSDQKFKDFAEMLRVIKCNIAHLHDRVESAHCKIEKLEKSLHSNLEDIRNELNKFLNNHDIAFKAIEAKLDSIMEILKNDRELMETLERSAERIFKFEDEFIKTMEEIQQMLDAKFDNLQAEKLNKLFDEQFGSFQKRLDHFSKLICDEAAGTTCKLVRNLQCIACGKLAVQKNREINCVPLRPAAVEQRVIPSRGTEQTQIPRKCKCEDNSKFL